MKDEGSDLRDGESTISMTTLTLEDITNNVLVKGRVLCFRKMMYWDYRLFCNRAVLDPCSLSKYR